MPTRCTNEKKRMGAMRQIYIRVDVDFNKTIPESEIMEIAKSSIIPYREVLASTREWVNVTAKPSTYKGT